MTLEHIYICVYVHIYTNIWALRIFRAKHMSSEFWIQICQNFLYFLTLGRWYKYKKKHKGHDYRLTFIVISYSLMILGEDVNFQEV